MILVILTLAFVLRIININQSLWLDEAINVLAFKNLSFWNLVTVYPLSDFHPPLYFGLMWFWTRVFGFTEILVRLPSVFFGVLTILLTYLIGKNFFTNKVGLMGAFFLAFNPLHVYYSQEARTYSLAALSASLSYFAFFNLLKQKRYSILFYGLSTLLVLYSDYLAYLVLVAQITYVLFLERNFLVKVISGQFFGSIFWLPWLILLPKQFQVGQMTAINVPGWKKVVGGSNLKELGLIVVKSIIGKVSISNKFLYQLILLPVISLFSYILLKTFKNLDKKTVVLMLWIVIPIVTAFLISIYVPILAYFRVIFILPAASLLIAIGIENSNLKIKKILTNLVIIIFLCSLAAYYFYPQFQREDWRAVVSFIEKSSGKGEVMLIKSNGLFAPLEYYNNPNLKIVPVLIKFPANEDKDVIDLGVKLNSLEKVYLLEYLTDISDPNRFVERDLDRLGFRKIKIHNFNGVGFINQYER